MKTETLWRPQYSNICRYYVQYLSCTLKG